MSSAGRRWLEVSVRCPTGGDRSALLADGLLALGARGAVERDGWFVAYFPEPSDPVGFLSEASDRLTAETGLDPISMRHAWQDHEEWAETWRRGLTTRRVTDRIVVHPSWIEPTGMSADDVVIMLDPGMAFGTAEHGTTRGCLRLLDGAVRSGDRVLDVGAGSGILSIAAAHLGATSVVAIEGDGLACEALAENVERNGVSARVEIVEAWATDSSLAARGPVSGIIANIESGLLKPLFRGFFTALAPTGWLIVSGVLRHEWAEIEALLAETGFRIEVVDADGEWRSGLLVRD
jgi:ribosomal protein L11 methyltransferase